DAYGSTGRAPSPTIRADRSHQAAAPALASPNERHPPHPWRLMGAGLRRPRVAWLDTRSRHALVLRDAKWIAHSFVWRAHGSESVLLLAGRRAGRQFMGGRAKWRRRRATRRAHPRRLR